MFFREGRSSFFSFWESGSASFCVHDFRINNIRIQELMVRNLVKNVAGIWESGNLWGIPSL